MGTSVPALGDRTPHVGRETLVLDTPPLGPVGPGHFNPVSPTWRVSVRSPARSAAAVLKDCARRSAVERDLECGFQSSLSASWLPRRVTASGPAQRRFYVPCHPEKALPESTQI
jgi:hypothetical protein